MKVKDAIEALSKLDPELYLCGYTESEVYGVFSGVILVPSEADEYHDSLPAGATYYEMMFDTIVPHVRGTGANAKKVPPDPPPIAVFECPRCRKRVEARKGSPPCCRCESWLPNLKEVT